MNQSGKAVIQLLTIAAWIGSLICWINPPIEPLGDFLLPILGSLLLAFCMYLAFRKDAVPDYLRRFLAENFQYGGFAFGIVPVIRNGECTFAILFQNRYSRTCQAIVELKPSRKFLLNRNEFDPIVARVSCEGGAFGICYVPVGVAREYQGRTQSFDVAAKCRYTDGKGEMLLFRDGINVTATTSEPWTQIPVAVGGIVLGLNMTAPKSARFIVELPQLVREVIKPNNAKTETEILWRRGDPEFATLPADLIYPLKNSSAAPSDGM